MTATATTQASPSSAGARTVRWSPVELLPSLLLLALGTMLLLPGHGLWYDELFTAEVGRVPLGELFAAVVEGRGITSYLADVPPSYNAPYYVLVNAWAALPGLAGDTDDGDAQDG